MAFRVLDLFCGAGGLSLGFKMANFDIVGGIDFNQEALDTHKLNFKDGFHFCGDISELDDEFVLENFDGKVDVIIGGPPCQGFSVANMQQKDIECDDRNKLFYEFIRFVRLLKPKAFVMENVPQILTKDKGHVKEVMMDVMGDLGYNVNVKVLVASDYGVPQRRRRAFFIGICKELNQTFDFDFIEKKPIVTVGDAISDLYSFDNEFKSLTVDDELDLDVNPLSEYQKLMRKDSDSKIHNHNIRYPKDIVQKRMEYVPEGGNWQDVPDELWDTIRNNRHSSAYRRLNSQDVSVTIDTGHMNYFHPKYNRVPTVRESARIQSFPDDFIFTGGQGAQFRQVGNAVPPLLSCQIAKTLKAYLNGDVDKLKINTTSNKTLDEYL
ncbi:DNA cytosine methyltransferase [Methanobrevibacter ruminantium]|uniref:DNA cytosine methyltransferase n=1 Tax=Methanobrevibacter ruminantium TaxID=83816 RepID=UPI0026EDF842|nr:DNA cytosine methyltransferase [Methanobrevibacter ruminantium]